MGGNNITQLLNLLFPYIYHKNDKNMADNCQSFFLRSPYDFPSDFPMAFRGSPQALPDDHGRDSCSPYTPENLIGLSAFSLPPRIFRYGPRSSAYRKKQIGKAFSGNACHRRIMLIMTSFVLFAVFLSSIKIVF